MPYTFRSVKDTEKSTDSSKLYNFIEDFVNYEEQFSLISKRYLVNRSTRQKIWKIFFYTVF